MDMSNRISDPRAFLSDLFLQAVAAVDPMKSIPDHLPRLPKGRSLLTLLKYSQFWRAMQKIRLRELQ